MKNISNGDVQESSLLETLTPVGQKLHQILFGGYGASYRHDQELTILVVDSNTGEIIRRGKSNPDLEWYRSLGDLYATVSFDYMFDSGEYLNFPIFNPQLSRTEAIKTTILGKVFNKKYRLNPDGIVEYLDSGYNYKKTKVGLKYSASLGQCEEVISDIMRDLGAISFLYNHSNVFNSRDAEKFSLLNHFSQAMKTNIIRGGSWAFRMKHSRSPNRNFFRALETSRHVGFRLTRRK